MKAELKARPFYLEDDQVRWVEGTLSSLTDEEKLGQLFCVMGGDYAPDALRDMVKAGQIGGVLFRPAPAQSVREWYEPLDKAAKIPLLKAANLEEGGAHWHGVCADKAVTLVKNTDRKLLPVTAERYPRVRLISLGKDEIEDGSVAAIAAEYLESAGFSVELYHPMEDELHGTSGLDPRRLTLYLANYEQASNQTTVRIDWCKKHALDIPRFLNEEPCVFVSFANPYHLQDVPRVRCYINAYNLLDNFQIRLILAKPGAKSMPKDMYREMRKQNRVALFFLCTKLFFLIVVPADPINGSVDRVRTHNVAKPILKDKARIPIHHRLI